MRQWTKERKIPVFLAIPMCFPSRFTASSSLNPTGPSASRMMSRSTDSNSVWPHLSTGPPNQDPEKLMLLMYEQIHHNEF